MGERQGWVGGRRLGTWEGGGEKVEERDEGWGESKQDSEERDGGVGGRDGGRLEGLGMQEGGIGESVGREGRVDGGWGGNQSEVLAASNSSSLQLGGVDDFSSPRHKS